MAQQIELDSWARQKMTSIPRTAMIPLIRLLRKDLSQMKLHLHGHGGSGISKRLLAEVVPR
jgi:hypothetical protein